MKNIRLATADDKGPEDDAAEYLVKLGLKI